MTYAFVREIEQLESGITRISTLFRYAGGAYVDIYKSTLALSDCSSTILEFCNYEKISELLNTSDIIIDLLDLYKIKYKGSEFYRKTILSPSTEDIFEFGEFCSIISWFFLKEKCHIV